MTGYRTGFIAGDKEVLKNFLLFRDAIGTETPVFVQHAAIAAWGDDDHVAVRRNTFSKKRSILKGLFQDKGLKYHDAPATFYMWLEAPRGTTGAEYAQRLLKVGIMVTPGIFFGANSSKYVRVALVPTVEQCVEAVGLWKDL